MKLSTLILFFMLWVFGLCSAQKNTEKLPYRKIPKYPENFNYGLLMAKIIDELGYTYYWASEGLSQKNLVNDYGSTNVLYSLLDNVDRISHVIASLTLNQPILDSVYVEKNLNELRKETLFNLKRTSEELYQTKDSTNLPLWEVLSAPISDIVWYNEQIISYQRKNGIPFDERIDRSNKLSQSTMFEESIGADGLTNNQWVRLTSLPVSSITKAILMKRQVRSNITLLAEIKKRRAVYLEVGKLEDVRLEPNVVDGKEYIYIGNPPSQISLSVSSDLDFINELIQWIIYINSGNEVGVDEIFRMDEYRGVNNEIIYLNSKKYRNIQDKDGNSIRFEMFPDLPNKNDFVDYSISHVLVNSSGPQFNQIAFIGERIKNAQFEESPEIKIMYIKNIEGSLFKRLIQKIDYFRDYRNESPDPPLLNLNNQ